MIARLIIRLVAWLAGRTHRHAASDNADAIDDDVLDAWLDEDEIGASGL